MRQMPRRIAATARALYARVFWRHQWRHQENPHPVRTCTVCGRCEVEDRDDWGPSWGTLVSGVQSRHYPKG